MFCLLVSLSVLEWGQVILQLLVDQNLIHWSDVGQFAEDRTSRHEALLVGRVTDSDRGPITSIGWASDWLRQRAYYLHWLGQWLTQTEGLLPLLVGPGTGSDRGPIVFPWSLLVGPVTGSDIGSITSIGWASEWLRQRAYYLYWLGQGLAQTEGLLSLLVGPVTGSDRGPIVSPWSLLVGPVTGSDRGPVVSPWSLLVGPVTGSDRGPTGWASDWLRQRTYCLYRLGQWLAQTLSLGPTGSDRGPVVSPWSLQVGPVTDSDRGPIVSLSGWASDWLRQRAYCLSLVSTGWASDWLRQRAYCLYLLGQ